MKALLKLGPGIAIVAGFSCYAIGSEFPEVYNSEKDSSLKPPLAEEAVSMWNLPDGFSVDLFASEPQVRNPIAMAWDRNGRMWVAENYTYAERARRFDLSLRDRVLVFEDKDGDGRADTRKVFTDQVQMLTSVEVGRGGVWLMCPPQLLFVPDKDGDDVPDREPEVVLDGFTVAQSNYHNFANGLRWGPDGWLYGRCGHSCPGNVGVPGTPAEKRVPIKGGIWRYHPERKTFEGLTHGTTNPWGHDWDRHGELFYINTVNGHLWHGIHGAHFTESFGADPNPFVYERIDTHADHYHYDRSGSWTKSRNGAANEFGGGHAHIGMMIYQGTSWPERFHDRLFTINMHGRRTNVERLERLGSGFVGRHEPDIFLMEDEWYRGLDIQPGPDGAVYIIDWSDTGECHEHTGVHRTSGRIYRLHYGEETSPRRVGSFSPNIVSRMDGNHPWIDRQVWAAGRAFWQGDAARAGLLRVLEGEGISPAARLRAMWAWYELTGEVLNWKENLESPHESIRKWTIRLLVDRQPIDTIVGPASWNLPGRLSEEVMSAFVEHAGEDDSGLVRLALASALQRLPVEDRFELGKTLAARTEDFDDHNLPEMVWYGVSPLAESNPVALVEIAKATTWPDLLKWIARAISSQMDQEPRAFESLLSIMSKGGEEKQVALLEGVYAGLQGWRKAPKPQGWDELARVLQGSSNEKVKERVRDLSVVFGSGRALEEIKEIVAKREIDYAIRRAALESLIESRPDDLREICESLLGDRLLNVTAARGLALFDDPRIGASLAKRYRRFYPADRPSVIEILASRPTWASILLDEIEKGEIPRQEVSAFQARQIRAFGDKDLSSRLTEVWGRVRESDEEKRALIDQWMKKLTPEVIAKADLPKGRQLYAGVCGACHIMYGEGGKIGPDLTGSGRSELEYLLENIFDPNSVVSADYQVSVLQLKDGRVLTGVIAGESVKAIELLQTTDSVTIARTEIEERKISPVSMMPEGLLVAFDEAQVRDLIGYLMHPVQIPLGGE